MRTQHRGPGLRSTVLFCVGTIGVIAEAGYSLVYRETPDPTLMIAFTAMMGLPVFLNQDSKGDNDRRRRDHDDDDADPSARPENRDITPSG